MGFNPIIHQAGSKRFYFCYLLLFLSIVNLPAQSNKQLIKMADRCMEEGNTSTAYMHYSKLTALSKVDMDDLLSFMNAAVHERQMEQASDLTLLIEQKAKGKLPEDYLFYKAWYLHLLGSYDASILAYKNFIRNASAKNPLRSKAKDYLLSCSYARRNNTVSTDIVNLESLADLNTPNNELKPVYSKQFNDVFYYSTAGAKSIGGLRDEMGQVDKAYGSYTFDMFKAQKNSNGFYVSNSLSYLLNSTSNEILTDFSADGQVLFFGKGNRQDQLKIYADTFNQNIYKRDLSPSPYSSINQSFAVFGLPVFYSGQVLLFASNQLEGYGGYDLYISFFENGKWSSAENLGPSVNTAYDEISPFLAKNGKSLYFSSNNPALSYGGFDVMKAVFLEHSSSWSAIENLGQPINSTGDDIQMVLSLDGGSALLASNRVGGQGGFDILNFQFKDQIQAQWSNISSSVFGHSTDLSEQKVAGEYFDWHPLYYGYNSVLLSNENQKYLNQVAQILTDDSDLRLVLEVHSNQADLLPADLYLDYQRALQVKEFLTNNGVSEGRVRIRVFGGQYKMAKSKVRGGSSDQANMVNNRIDLLVWSINEDYINDEYQWPYVDSLNRDEKFNELMEFRAGMTYTVEVLKEESNTSEAILSRYPPLTITSDPIGGSLSFQLGLFKQIGQARTLKNSLDVLGYPNARIRVYFNGYLLDGEELNLFMQRFPGISWPN